MSQVDVGAVVIGAGPYGLATASHLRERGVEHRTFGTTMGGWIDHMPVGMFLKSTALDSSIGSPHQTTEIGAWCASAGVEPYDKDGGETPIPIAEFIEYFHKRAGSPPPVAPIAMAMGFMSLVEGVKLSMLSSPTEMTQETAESVLLLFVDSIMSMARIKAAEDGGGAAKNAKPSS